MDLELDSESAAYLRISDDREGQERGVGRQLEDSSDLAAKQGRKIPLANVFEDNDTGASALSTKPRPGFEAMLIKIRAGRIKRVFAYSNSRLTRRPLEFEMLIQLHLQTGVMFHTVVSGDDDLSTADGRMVARIKANVDAAEAERTSERLQRRRLQDAQDGRTWTSGERAFGWLEDRETMHPIEGPLIQRAVADILDGKPVNQVARDWNEAGITTARGGTWSPAQVGQLLKRPRLAGWRVHKGEIARDRDGHQVRGRQDIILDQDTFDRLTLMREGRATSRVRVPRRGARQYMLSRLARCGICGGPMSGQRISDVAHNYSCSMNPAARDHTNTASGRSVDALVTAQLILKSGEAQLDPTPRGPWEFEERRTEVDREMREIMNRIRSKESKIPKAMLWAEAEALGQEQEELEKARTAWLRESTGPGLSPTLTLEAFMAMDVYEQQNEIVGHLGGVIIQPPAVTRTGSRFDPERVEFLRD